MLTISRMSIMTTLMQMFVHTMLKRKVILNKLYLLVRYEYIKGCARVYKEKGCLTMAIWTNLQKWESILRWDIHIFNRFSSERLLRFRASWCTFGSLFDFTSISYFKFWVLVRHAVQVPIFEDSLFYHLVMRLLPFSHEYIYVLSGKFSAKSLSS